MYLGGKLEFSLIAEGFGVAAENLPVAFAEMDGMTLPRTSIWI